MGFRLNGYVRTIILCLGVITAAWSGEAGAAAEDGQTPAASAADAVMTPLQRVQSSPKGSLKNPYNPGQADIVAEGRELFMSYSCSGCHGGTGGGGMCPPINGEVWFYGLDDDTLFRLISVGSVELQKEGFQRLGGPGGLQMPPFGGLIKSDDELWKILTWVRSVYKGDPKKKTW